MKRKKKNCYKKSKSNKFFYFNKDALKVQAGPFETFLLVGGMIIFFWTLCYIYSDAFVFLYKLLWKKSLFPITLIILCGLTLILKKYNDKQFTFKELFFFIGISIFTIIPVTVLSYLFFSDGHDFEIWNGYVSGVKHSLIRNDNGSSDDYSYIVNLLTGREFYCTTDEKTFQNILDYWGYNYKYKDYRNKRINRNIQKEPLPVAMARDNFNYFRLSKSIIKKQGFENDFKGLIKKYPSLYYNSIGISSFDRVITTNILVPDKWIKSVDFILDKKLLSIEYLRKLN